MLSTATTPANGARDSRCGLERARNQREDADDKPPQHAGILLTIAVECATVKLKTSLLAESDATCYSSLHRVSALLAMTAFSAA
jgi:hypothetical protein